MTASSRRTWCETAFSSGTVLSHSWGRLLRFDSFHTMTQAIAAANDTTLCEVIRRAQRRLTILAPALTRPVGEAVAERWGVLPADAISVILDIDPEVYRLGYGHPEALTLLQETAQRLRRAITSTAESASASSSRMT